MKYRLWLDDIRPKPADEMGIEWLAYRAVEDMITYLSAYLN